MFFRAVSLKQCQLKMRARGSFHAFMFEKHDDVTIQHDVITKKPPIVRNDVIFIGKGLECNGNL